MMQENELIKRRLLGDFVVDSDVLKINVFTSSSCTFCSKAVDAAKVVADKFNQLDLPIEVVETSVEERPDIIEALNVIALPVIVIGNSQIVGLPNQEDIELLLHQAALGG